MALSNDSYNEIDLYSGGSLIASYDAPAVLASLSSAYKGNPNPQFRFGDPGEPFAYVNFIGTEGTTFNAVRFKTPLSNGGLEVDNISIRGTPLSEPFPGTIVNGGGLISDPSPLLTGGPLLGLLLALGTRRAGK